MFSVTLSPCDGDSSVLGFTRDFVSLEDAKAYFNEYSNLSEYGGEPFDLFLEDNGTVIADTFK